MGGGQIRLIFVLVLLLQLCHIGGVKNAAADAIEEVVGIGFMQAAPVAHPPSFLFDCCWCAREATTCSEAGGSQACLNIVLRVGVAFTLIIVDICAKVLQN